MLRAFPYNEPGQRRPLPAPSPEEVHEDLGNIRPRPFRVAAPEERVQTDGGGNVLVYTKGHNLQQYEKTRTHSCVA